MSWLGNDEILTRQAVHLEQIADSLDRIAEALETLVERLDADSGQSAPVAGPRVEGVSLG